MSDGSLALTLVRAVISLALVLGLLLMCLRALARRGGASVARNAAVPLDVLGRRQMSRGASVQVVRVGEQVLVLGVTDTQVSVLTHLSPEVVAADEVGGPTDGTATDRVPSGSSAAGLLRAARGQGRASALVSGLWGITGRPSGGRHRGGSRV